MISFKEDNIRFNYRIAGVCLHNGRVLLHRAEHDDFWSLPGGRAELLENSKECIAREIFEETGYTISVERPLWFLECFFHDNDEQVHEISVIYKFHFLNNSDCLEKDTFYGIEDSLPLVFKWFRVEDLHKIELYPIFLKEALKEPPEYFKHIIHKDN